MAVVFARKCAVVDISHDEAHAFVEENHSSGAASKAGVIRSIGLMHDGELIMLVQFCHPRTAKMKRMYTVELVRMCTKLNYRVPGGASKLVKHYISKYKPFDFFTYQDTTGEVTDVYSQCGMRLVRQDKEKRYLVAPGKYLNTALRKEKLGMAYAVQYGPDRILGTDLGQVFNEGGTRLTNVQLFTDRLGWTIQNTSGDRLYEWRDDSRTNYVYKITASDSDKYYIGVSHVKKPNATHQDCLKDPYMGSGKQKFTNWKKAHKGKLKKSILLVTRSRSEALELESKLVGDRWMTDPKCLNSLAGGIGNHPVNHDSWISMRECPEHGLTKHAGKSCQKCSTRNNFTTRQCIMHGLTSHIGDLCQKCFMAVTKNTCEVHGDVNFQRGVCLMCSSAKSVSEKVCEVHGLTKHHGELCSKCQISKTDSIKQCPIHGMTKHRGSSCFTCVAQSKVEIKQCPIHGMVKHNGSSCYICHTKITYTEEECPKHGLTKFQSGKCCKCSNKMTTVETCETHGETKFQWGKCRKCRPPSNRKKKAPQV